MRRPVHRAETARYPAIYGIFPADRRGDTVRRRNGQWRRAQPTCAPSTAAVRLAAAGHGSFATDRATEPPPYVPPASPDEDTSVPEKKMTYDDLWPQANA